MELIAKPIVLLALIIGMFAAWDVPPITTWQWWVGVLCFVFYAAIDKHWRI
jgi:hypothetical protein